MQSQKPVRTYLDPDTVGPLPRCSHADDSDALSAARTIERPPMNTVELAPEDVLEIFDPRRPRRPSSLAPVGYDAAPVAPRRRLGNVVMGVVTVASVIVAIAAVRGSSRSSDASASLAAAAHAPETAPPAAAPRTPAVSPSAAVAPLPASQPESAPESASPVVAASASLDLSTVGTIRVDPQAEGHRVWVDGFELTADAAIVRCGLHRVKVGSVGQTRTVDVPCGGDITVFR